MVEIQLNIEPFKKEIHSVMNENTILKIDISRTNIHESMENEVDMDANTEIMVIIKTVDKKLLILQAE